MKHLSEEHQEELLNIFLSEEPLFKAIHQEIDNINSVVDNDYSYIENWIITKAFVASVLSADNPVDVLGLRIGNLEKNSRKDEKDEKDEKDGKDGAANIVRHVTTVIFYATYIFRFLKIIKGEEYTNLFDVLYQKLKVRVVDTDAEFNEMITNAEAIPRLNACLKNTIPDTYDYSIDHTAEYYGMEVETRASLKAKLIEKDAQIADLQNTVKRKEELISNLELGLNEEGTQYNSTKRLMILHKLFSLPIPVVKEERAQFKELCIKVFRITDFNFEKLCSEGNLLSMQKELDETLKKYPILKRCIHSDK